MRICKIGMIAALLLGLTAAGRTPAQELVITKILQSHQQQMQFVVVDGRVTFNNTRILNYNSRSSLTYNGKPRSETLKLQTQIGWVQLTYDCTSESEELKFAVSGSGDTVSISRAPRDGSSIVRVEYSQVPDKKIKLTIGAGEEARTSEANEIWQLILERPKECEEHLFPLLEMLRPNWKLAETAAKIERHLLLGAGEEIRNIRERWNALVEQLGDDQFAKREAADRALRADGVAAAAYLRRLDVNSLDAEQQFRIRRIIESLNQADGDETPEDVAERLAGEPIVWLALLGNADRNHRITAAKQLSVMLGEDIGIDPAADPETQIQQRERLRAKIEAR